MQQTDRDGLDPFGDQAVHHPFDLGGVERAFDLALAVHALVNLEAKPPLDQRWRLFVIHVVEPGHAKRPDLEDVAKALGGDKPGARALVLEDGVRSDGRAMQHLVNLMPRHARRLEHLRQAFGDSARIVVDGGGNFLGDDSAITTQKDDVCEGAADIDADPVAAHAMTTSLDSGGGDAGSRTTDGVDFQPRVFRMRARSAFVASMSTSCRTGSITTP